MQKQEIYTQQTPLRAYPTAIHPFLCLESKTSILLDSPPSTKPCTREGEINPTQG